MKKNMFDPVSPQQSFPELEEKILDFWKNNFIFKKSIDQRTDSPDYTFYDGPPFATGLPHYGHIVASTLKDTVPRYFTMRGYKVERRFGWDCHGLPVENEVEKSLNLHNKKEIDEMGVSAFNEKCRSIVLKYVYEWEKIIERMGRWVDFYDDYKTMDPNYMESIWWVFKTLWDKGLVYEGHKAMHVCPRCETPLSNFEVTQGYKDIDDQTVTAKFKLKNESNTYLLAWTSTAWTLPGNIALTVGAEIDYVKVKLDNSDELYILAKALISDNFSKEEKETLKIISEMKGSELVGKKYEPLFDYFINYPEAEKGWEIFAEDFVSTEDGTGIVHIASYGEDDMMVIRKYKLPFIQHVKMDGTFIKEVTEFYGQDARASDKNIIRYLKENNKLFRSFSYRHSYPHCWRCDTPLLNYATNSWFIKIEAIKEKMLVANNQISWVPDHLKHGRFGKWLENARDWAISRNRFWGTPLPIWRCECGELKCLGAMEDLRTSLPDRYTKLILIRHGQSEGNLSSLRQSKAPGTPLTKEGRRQASECGKQLKNQVIDYIYCSPLERTKQTCQIISKSLDMEYTVNEQIREIDFGESEGKTNSDLKDIIWSRYRMPVEDKYKQAVDTKSGESHEQVTIRMKKFIDEVLKKHRGKTIAIISHSDPLRFLEKEICGLNLKKVYASGHKPYAIPTTIYIDNKTGKPIDLHKHFVDDINIPCPKCNAKMSRVPEVLDCWFESGSMPYAQIHYPFENKKWFDENFPADFIAEGLDQTRGWFYTLVVLGVALFDKPAFKNIIVNGIVLAEDGKKMSKRLKNYPDPKIIYDKYGADAMRYYLLSSPVVHANDLRFSEKGVAEVLKNISLPLWNVYSFLVTYANIDKWEPQIIKQPKNILDRFIISRLNSFIKNVTESMDSYELQKAFQNIPEFLDDLTNWYIRRSRRRFWRSENDNDKEEAYRTLYTVLIETAKVIAPIMPFISDSIFKNLTKKESVHLENWPEVNAELIDPDLESQVHYLRSIVTLGHAARSKAKIKVRQPLAKIQIVLPPKIRAEVIELEKAILLEELNVKEIEIIKNIEGIAIEQVFPIGKIIGPKYGSAVQKIIKMAKSGRYTKQESGGITVKVDGQDYNLSSEEIEIRYIGKEGFGVESSEGIVTALDINITDDLKLEGQARDIVRLIQDMRKEAGYEVSDRIELAIHGADKVIQKFGEHIKQETLAEIIKTEIIEADLVKEDSNIKIMVKIISNNK